MKKLLGIVVLGLFIGFNPLIIKFSYAGLLDIFSDPLEVCMDKVLDKTNVNSAYAAKVCAGSTKATLKCMDRVVSTSNVNMAYAAKVCTGND